MTESPVLDLQVLERLIRDRAQELEWDVQELRRLEQELKPAMAKLNQMQTRLADMRAESELPAAD